MSLFYGFLTFPLGVCRSIRLALNANTHCERITQIQNLTGLGARLEVARIRKVSRIKNCKNKVFST